MRTGEMGGDGRAHACEGFPGSAAPSTLTPCGFLAGETTTPPLSRIPPPATPTVSYFSSTCFLGLHFALFLRSFSWYVALSMAAPRSPCRWLRLILITGSCASFFHATGLHLTAQSASERSQGSWRCEQTVGAGGAVSVGRIWDGTRKYGTPVEVFPSFFFQSVLLYFFFLLFDLD